MRYLSRLGNMIRDSLQSPADKEVYSRLARVADEVRPLYQGLHIGPVFRDAAEIPTPSGLYRNGEGFWGMFRAQPLVIVAHGSQKGERVVEIIDDSIGNVVRQHFEQAHEGMSFSFR